jgi:hypothetical protein
METVSDTLGSGINGPVSSRYDVFLPCRPPTPLHQLGIVAGLV